MSADRTCRTCVHWRKWVKGIFGDCRSENPFGTTHHTFTCSLHATRLAPEKDALADVAARRRDERAKLPPPRPAR